MNMTVQANKLMPLYYIPNGVRLLGAEKEQHPHIKCGSKEQTGSAFLELLKSLTVWVEEIFGICKIYAWQKEFSCVIYI